MSFLHQRRQLYGRLAWLDELRLIAILLMVIDHALLFLSPSGVWPGVIRLTLTRCAEPLFVFVLKKTIFFKSEPVEAARKVVPFMIGIMTSEIINDGCLLPVVCCLSKCFNASFPFWTATTL